MLGLKLPISRRYFLALMQGLGVTAYAQGNPKTQVSQQFRIGFGSCLLNTKGAQILDTVVGADPDLFVWLGDNIYGDTEDMRALAQHYAELGSNPRFINLNNHCENIAIWDDHDYGLNNAGQEYRKKVESRSLFLNFWKVPQDDPRWTHEGIYGSYFYGPESHRIHMILLDGRYFRSTNKSDPNGTMLGAGQWAWLEEEIQKPSALKIICSGIQVVSTEHGYEGWSEFPKERNRLFNLIKKYEVPGVIFTSGDQHWSEMSKLDGALGYPAYDLTASSLDQSWPVPRNSLRVGKASAYAGFGMIVLDWAGAEPVVRLQLFNAKGVVIEEQVVALSSLVPTWVQTDR